MSTIFEHAQSKGGYSRSKEFTVETETTPGTISDTGVLDQIRAYWEEYYPITDLVLSVSEDGRLGCVYQLVSDGNVMDVMRTVDRMAQETWEKFNLYTDFDFVSAMAVTADLEYTSEDDDEGGE